jgi:3-hydroxyisobutyrate dehydrogenase-like beta-hydroxyacid dehydrogenase
MTLQHEPVGFIGVGNMGRPMVENLLAGGVRVRAYDGDPDRVRASGAEPAPSVEAAVTPGGVTISMVPDDGALEQVALADDGVLARIGAGVHLSMSTVSAQLSETLEARYAERGATFLAATVLGRPDVAQAAGLTVFLAGAEAGKRRSGRSWSCWRRTSRTSGRGRRSRTSPRSQPTS